jgi:hypothetical protein
LHLVDNETKTSRITHPWFISTVLLHHHHHHTSAIKSDKGDEEEADEADILRGNDRGREHRIVLIQHKNEEQLEGGTFEPQRTGRSAAIDDQRLTVPQTERDCCTISKKRND